MKSVSNWLRDAETDPGEPAPSLADRGRVLVIDDNVESLSTLKETLPAEGFSVLRFNCATKGLSMLQYAGARSKRSHWVFDTSHLDGVGTLKFIQQLAPQATAIAVIDFDDRSLPASFQGDLPRFSKSLSIFPRTSPNCMLCGN